MKLLVISLLLTGMPSSPPLGQQPAPPLKDLLTDREFERYRKTSNYKDRINFFRKTFATRSDLLQQFVRRDEGKKVADVLYQLRSLAQHLAKGSPRQVREKDLRSKEVKRLEISLRKLIDRIKDFRSVVTVENRDQFDLTAQALEDLRRTLLKQMFGDVLARHKAPLAWNLIPGSIADMSQMVHRPTPQRTGGRWMSGDRFTQAEYRSIQENQKLEKRVEVFLEIAESRLNEIRRRRLNQEWKEDEENSLEFYTYWDMVHAYLSSLNSMMINIDEKATHKTASKDELRRSLEKIDKKIGKFPSRLKPIEKLAVELQDEILYREILKAQEATVVVQKGVRYGLEVLEK